MLEQHLCLLDHRRTGLREGRCEGRNAVALLAAEEFIDGHAEGFALDVVERYVDGRDRRLQHAPALEILAAVHFLPQGADPERIAPTQELRIMLERADNGLLAAGQTALAPAENALIRLDLQQKLVP